jgi:hypothetical protein
MKTSLTLLTLSLLTSLSFAASPIQKTKGDAREQKEPSKSLELRKSAKAIDSKDLSLRSSKHDEKSTNLKEEPQRESETMSLKGGGQEGNGAGGIRRNGNYLTFYSAGIIINPRPKLANEIPTLDQVIAFLSTTKVMSSTQAGSWLEKVLPSDKHQYFDVDPSYFTPQVELRLKAEYSRVTGIPVNELTLFAITDPKAGETYLLPTFYKLKKDTEKMAILMHENAWLDCPKCQYKDIVKLEMLSQAHFENPNDAKRAYALAGYFGVRSALRFAFYHDKENGILVDGSVLKSDGNTMKLKVGDLLGDAYYFCVQKNGDTSDQCRARALLNMTRIRMSFPSSMLMTWLSEYTASGDISIRTEGNYGYCTMIIRYTLPSLFIQFIPFTERNVEMPNPEFSAISNELATGFDRCTSSVKIVVDQKGN